MRRRPADEAVASPFFRAYAGSGRVIQRLARSQCTPRRTSVARTVSPLTSRSVSPWRWASQATRSSVHRLVEWPKSRGLRCKSARKCSALGASKAAWVVWGRDEPGVSAANPSRLKAWMALRTVCSLPCRLRAICGTVVPRALASRIWLRRTVKTSAARRAVVRVRCSASESGRTKMGVLMPPMITHSRLPHLMPH